MSRIDIPTLERLAPIDQRDEVIEFKDEGETSEGMPIGKLTFRSSGEAVFPDGRWATKARARRIARHLGVDFLEY
ncbi:MAG: hypothetical protein HYR74_09015 [Candidatus Eisenbacteria bacterium]|nr:hypothetical protein [Candidatus Eisenbacteria bacterium]